MTYIATYNEWAYICNADCAEAARGIALAAAHEHVEMLHLTLSDLTVQPMTR